MSELNKWRHTIRIEWTKLLNYKTDLALRIVGPSVVFFLIKLNIWQAIYRSNDLTQIKGFTLADMLEYQAWVLIVAFLGQGYNSMNLSEEIRYGKITAYLLYPFEFWKYHLGAFLAFEALQLLIAALTISLFVGGGLIPDLSFRALATGIAFALASGLLWYVIQFTFGIMAFWLEETWVLRVIFAIVADFLSGAVFPLEIFPPWLQKMVALTPFPYLTSIPVKILSGQFSGNLPQSLIILATWMVLAFFLARAVWHRGVRLYTAAGI